MHRRFAFAFSFVLLLVALSDARAEQTIRYDLLPGLRYAFEQNTATEMDMTVEAGGQTMQMTQKTEQVASGVVEVLEVEDGRTRVAQITFAEESATKMSSSMMPQAQRMPFPLAGRTVVVTMDAEGKTTFAAPEGEANLPPLTPDIEETVRGLAIPDPAFPPKKPVEVGDSWTTKLGHVEDAARTDCTFTVLGFDTEAEPATARLKAAATIEAEQEGATINGDVSGAFIIDLETGLALEATVEGPIEMKGTSEMGGGMTAKIDAKGTLKQTTELRYLDDAEEAAGSGKGATGAGGARD